MCSFGSLPGIQFTCDQQSRPNSRRTGDQLSLPIFVHSNHPRNRPLGRAARKQRTLVSHSCGGWKSELKMPEGSGSGDSLCLVQVASHSPCPHGQDGRGGSHPIHERPPPPVPDTPPKGSASSHHHTGDLAWAGGRLGAGRCPPACRQRAVGRRQCPRPGGGQRSLTRRCCLRVPQAEGTQTDNLFVFFPRHIRPYPPAAGLSQSHCLGSQGLCWTLH